LFGFSGALEIVKGLLALELPCAEGFEVTNFIFPGLKIDLGPPVSFFI